jgi:hypothetical protein
MGRQPIRPWDGDLETILLFRTFPTQPEHGIPAPNGENPERFVARQRRAEQAGVPGKGVSYCGW